MKLSRRTLLRSGAAALAAPAARRPLRPRRQRGARRRKHWRHGLSLFGDPKYPAGFKHFDYVNPDAPKGGIGAPRRASAPSTISTSSSPGVKGTIAAGIDLIYDTLMTPALDEVSTEYGLLAEAVQLSGGFLLRHLPAARRKRTGTTASR